MNTLGAARPAAVLQPDGRRRRVLLLGNPNTGKTSLFNRLAGTRHRVGNYPGVTVERVETEVTLPSGASVLLVDLPGTYSLSARSAEERIALDQSLGRGEDGPPDLVVLVLDATQLERNLYLAVQVREFEIPCVVALNLCDEARDRGIDIDIARLRVALHAPIHAVSARTGEGLGELLHSVEATLAHGRRAMAVEPGLDPEHASVVDEMGRTCVSDGLVKTEPEGRALARWALVSGADAALPDSLLRAVSARSPEWVEAVGDSIVAARYAAIDALVAEAVVRDARARVRPADRVDAVLLHPLWGFLLFIGVMAVVFQGLFSWSEPAIGAIEVAFGWAASAARSLLPAGLLADFVADALIGGVGAVLVFLPQIVLLFLFVGLMEDSGYMARVAYLMDRIMRAVGLHGRAFVPMLSGFACAVPAILATRTMERQRDRLLTMLVVPLMSCSARLPVYTLILGALFSEATIVGLPAQGLLMVALYLGSTVLALVVAAILGRTLAPGERVPLILELPPYRLPSLRTVAQQVSDRALIFVREAGTVILLCTAVLWVLLHVPRVEVPPGTSDEAAQKLQIEGSLAGSLGRAIEPAIAPLGFDWKIGIGLVGAFAAREVFVATLGVVYGAGADVDESSDTLRERIAKERRPDGSPVYDTRTGLSLLVFFALSAQCLSTLAAVRRETRSWRWPAFLFAYMTVLAWVASFLVYRVGGWIIDAPL